MWRRCLVLAILALTYKAHAGVLGADVEWSRPLPSGSSDGPGFQLRYGQELKKMPLRPELGVAWLPYGAQHLVGGFGGARLSVGDTLAPGLLAHVGYLGSTSGGGGLLLTGGGLLELHLSSVRVGVHGRYARVEGLASWIGYGAHLDLTL